MRLKPWKSCLYALLLHPTKAKVSLVSRNDNYCLPYIEIDREIEFDDFQTIKAQVEQKLGISVNILHYASYQRDEEKHWIKAIYVLEQQNPTEEIPIGILCDRSNLETLSFIDPEQKSIVEAYLTELESANTPKLRPPWAQTGWFNEASAWIEEQLEKLAL